MADIKKEDDLIANFIKEQFQTIVNKGMMQEVLLSHIHPLMTAERLPIVEEKIIQIIAHEYRT